MSKPSLDDIEITILKTRLDVTLGKWKSAQEDSPFKRIYAEEMERDQKRYHHLTGGRWYTYRHSDQERQDE